MTTTVSNISAALKTIWPQNVFYENLYENRPLLGMLPKDETFGGNDIKLSTRFGPGSGVSARFAKAQGNKGPSSYAAFTLQRKQDFGVFSITGEALRAARLKKGSLFGDIVKDGEGTFNAVMNRIGWAIYGNGGGALGRISSGSASETLTLTDPADIVKFERNMYVVSDDTDGTSGGADDDEPIQITAVNRDAGTITKATGSNWNANSNFAAQDYLFTEGDFGLKINGLQAWLPASAPGSSDDFLGVNRSQDSTRLAGVRFTASSARDGSIHRAIMRCAARLQREGGKPDSLFLNPMDWVVLEQELETKTAYNKQAARGPDGKQIATVGYNTLRLATPAGEIDIYSDMYCPKGRGYMLQLDTWKIYSLGPCPGWLMEDDNGNILRESSADAYEGRFGTYYELGCEAPGFNATLDLSAVTVADIDS